MSALSIAPDYMHNHYLGWLQYLYGSIFWLLCFVVLPHEEPLENLDYIEQFIKRYQKMNPANHKYRPKLDKLSMFQKKVSVILASLSRSYRDTVFQQPMPVAILAQAIVGLDHYHDVLTVRCGKREKKGLAAAG